MSACFGLHAGGCQSARIPAGCLTEDHCRIDVWERDGGSPRPALWSDLVRAGREIEVTYDEPMIGYWNGKPVARPWFLCPVCGRRCRHIYLQRMACRVCSGLDYSSRHRNRSIPGFNKLVSLRAKIGAGAPFTPITPRPRSHLRYNRTVAQIGELEAGLLTHLRHDICDVLERRIELRGLK